MKKFFLISSFLLISTTLFAQQPKLDMKVYGGVHGQRYIYRSEDISKEYYPGWQGGFGFRVSYRQLFAEMDVEFVRSKITIDLGDTVATDFRYVDLKLNAMNIPIKVGFIPVKKAFFKWYVYTGLNNRLNTRAIIVIDNEDYKFKPRDLNLHVYNLDFILGTQADLGWLNVDIYYGTGITNSYSSDLRTNHHQLLINVGFLF